MDVERKALNKNKTKELATLQTEKTKKKKQQGISVYIR